MSTQNLVNRILLLEQKNKGLLESKKLTKFFKSLPVEDQNKIHYSGGVIIFRGQVEDWRRIISAFGITEKKVLIDDIEDLVINKNQIEKQ